ncbi:MAG TPA: putative metal-binding motif-containing protein, partial [Patescibacteria group bacterium]|nr:putative metal-binding motif-containing protein [Patescibacteria group bacterium]
AVTDSPKENAKPRTAVKLGEFPQQLLQDDLKKIDQDGDGAPIDIDCDDQDPRRAPGFPELCDGIDNDCDGLEDEDFDVDSWCETNDPCQPWGRIRCDSLLSSSCQWDDVGCM